MQRRAVDPTGSKEIVICRVVPHRSEIGSNVRSIGGDGYGVTEGDLLPAGCGLVRERGRSDQSPRSCPNVGDVSANICIGLVEAQTGYITSIISSEFDSEFNRLAIATVDQRGSRGWLPYRIQGLTGHRQDDGAVN